MNDSPIPLTELSTSEEGLIVAVEGPEAGHLSGYGLYPGMIVRVHQTFPSFVIKADETEVALETQVARRIRVTRIETPRRTAVSRGRNTR